MRRFVVMVAAGLAMASTSPTLTAAGASQAEPTVDVIVVLRSHADLSQIAAPSRREHLRLIEKALRDHAVSTQRGALDLLAGRGSAVSSVTSLWGINALAVRARADVIRELAARPEVREVRPDFTLQAPAPPAATATASGVVEPNVGLVDAPALWDLGYRGQGMVVASMDTGVDVSHPELAAGWRGGSGSWYDPNGQHPATPTDVNGHGTQTMGVMVGRDAGGSAIGVAPDARWIAVKIFNDRGQASASGIHLGFQWLLDPDGNPATADAPNVVNNSWTMAAGSCTLDFQPDLRNLRAAGILPVFAAGNYGPADGTSASPANNPEAFAVGATDDNDTIDPSSSRGPSACGQAPYPQLTAPGVGIRTTDLYGGYIDSSGTSLAAPHVAGAVALLLQALPGLSADRQAAALQAGSVDLGTPGPDNTYGTGRLDVRAAYDWARSTPDFALAASPASRSIAAGTGTSYDLTVAPLSGFTADVTLSLTGLPANVGTAALTPTTIHGSGTSTLSLSTATTAPAGSYQLIVTGTSSAITHTAAVTLTVLPRDFTLGASPASVTVTRTQTATYTISASAVNGFTGQVALKLTGQPTGTTTTWTGNPITVPGTATVKVRTTSSTPRATFTLKLTGTSGTLTHQIPITLTVR